MGLGLYGVVQRISEPSGEKMREREREREMGWLVVGFCLCSLLRSSLVTDLSLDHSHGCGA